MVAIVKQCAGNLEQIFEQHFQAILQSWSRRLVYVSLLYQDCREGGGQDCQATLRSWSPNGKIVSRRASGARGC